MPFLRIDLPEGDVLHHALQPGRTTLGRSSGNDIVISDLSLSREHAVIFTRGEDFFIEDAGSRNGTFLNTDRIEGPTPLRIGDVVKIGSSRIHIREDDTPSPVHAPLQSEIVTWTEARPETGAEGMTETSRKLIVQQLDLAREIQRFLLPQQAPDLPGYRIAGDTQPCYEVGGDFFDYCLRDDGRLVIVVADVARKGLGAALLGHYAQAYMRGAVGHERKIETLVARMNDDIAAHSPPNQYVNAAFCDLDHLSGDLAYVNVGHCQPLVVRHGGDAEYLPGRNLLLGVLPGVTYESGHTRLEPGEMLVMYTDGITECMGPGNEQYGSERLMTFMRERASMDPDGILRDLEAELERFTNGRRPGDDITLMILQRIG